MAVAEEVDGSQSVATVAQLVGVAPSTLRTWARRYGLEPSAHRSGLHRRYSAVDITRLQLMRLLTASGMSSRDAANRALAARPDQLELVRAAHAQGAPGALAEAAVAAVVVGLPPRAGRPDLDSLDPAVRLLVGAAARGDAIGATALVRGFVRELGGARTFDERVLPSRVACSGAAPAVGQRVRATVDRAVVEAAGEAAPRRSPRNDVPVVLAALPGCADDAALVLAQAAFADRSIAVRRAGQARSVDDILRVDGGGVLVVLGDDDVAGAASRLRGAAPAVPHVLWGPGWMHWPGRPGSLADVVRTVEPLCTSDR